MKKYTVISKRKNPDKYIEYLKRRLDWALNNSRKAWDRWKKEKGSYVATYRERVESGLSETTIENARKFRVGDEVIVTGHVFKIQKQGEGYCVYWTSEEIRVRGQ